MDLSSETSIGTTRIWKIENGYTEATPAERAALATFFGVDEADVFTTPEAPTQTKTARMKASAAQ